MKKIFSLLLALSLCLPLCACGNEEKRPETQSTITESAKIELAKHPLYSKLFGTWENHNKDDAYAPYQTLIMNEDGSCIMDGTAATWEWDGSIATSTLTVNILVDGKRVCGAILFDDGTIVGQTSNYGIGGWFFNTSKTEQ